MLKRILVLTICVFCLLPVMAKANDEPVLIINTDQALLEVPEGTGTVEFIGDIEIGNLVINGNVNLYIHDTLDVETIDQTVGDHFIWNIIKNEKRKIILLSEYYINIIGIENSKWLLTS